MLGRDAETGAPVPDFAPAGVPLDVWRAMTAEPRSYGFHATLKAPFRLKPGRSAAELEAAVAQLAASVAAFDLGPLQVSSLRFSGGGFVALTPVSLPPTLRDLEARAVRELDAFRAPLTEDEIARRRPDRLTPRQREHLDAWGYPYVLDEFRLHFTLSGATVAPEPLAEALAQAFAESVAPPHGRVDDLALYVQQPGADFVVARRFELGSA